MTSLQVFQQRAAVSSRPTTSFKSNLPPAFGLIGRGGGTELMCKVYGNIAVYIYGNIAVDMFDPQTGRGATVNR